MLKGYKVIQIGRQVSDPVLSQQTGSSLFFSEFLFSIACIFQITLKAFCFVIILLVLDFPLLSQIQSLGPTKDVRHKTQLIKKGHFNYLNYSFNRFIKSPFFRILPKTGSCDVHFFIVAQNTVHTRRSELGNSICVRHFLTSAVSYNLQLLSKRPLTFHKMI